MTEFDELYEVIARGLAELQRRGELRRLRMDAHGQAQTHTDEQTRSA